MATLYSNKNCGAIRESYGRAVLAVVMVVPGYATAIATARGGFDPGGDLNSTADPHGFLAFQLGVPACRRHRPQPGVAAVVAWLVA